MVLESPNSHHIAFATYDGFGEQPRVNRRVGVTQFHVEKVSSCKLRGFLGDSPDEAKTVVVHLSNEEFE